MNARSAIIYFFLIFLPALLFSQTPKYWLNHSFPHVVVNNKLWVGTEKGLYQYHPEEDVWAIFGDHNGLCSNDVKMLFWDGEFLWVVTSGGLSCGDIKLNKWIKYTTENGLPGNNIFSVALHEDYIWIGTDNGAARFDKLIQEWETFNIKDGLPDTMVYDIVAEGDIVYLATAKGLVEYNTNFEKWRYYGKQEGIPSDTIKFIYPTTEYLWLFTDIGPCRFSKKLHTSISFTDDPRLKYENIKDMVVDNESMWVTGDNGILIYEPANNIWRDFPEGTGLPDQSVKSISISSRLSWFVTDGGIASLDGETKSWQKYDRSRGLTSDNYDRVINFSGKVFLINDSSVDYLNIQENRWYYYQLKDMSSGGAEKQVHLSMDREKGSYLQLGREMKFDISSSRYTLRMIDNNIYELNTGESENTFERSHRGDLKSQISLPGNRSINGFYNNIDYLDKDLYGIRYKGNEDDVVQEIQWGDVRYDQGKKNIYQSMGVLGTSVKLETGPKTEKYKRSFFSVNGVSGKQNSGNETDFFTGNYQNDKVTVYDINYIKDIYFEIDTSGNFTPFDEGTDILYVNDGSTITNTDNTLISFEAGGLTGDFDRYEPFLDYYFDNEQGIIQLLKPAGDSSVIVITGRSSGIDVEYVLRNRSMLSNEIVNRYFLGGMQIIPVSFRMEITDSLGASSLLSEFGLDDDNNDLVDPEYIHYRDGILTFPVKKPFGEEVYSDTQPSANYRFDLYFQSEISIFNLSFDNLIRGSEHVIVDGEILSPGQDYVLDYTSGTLLIIKQGIIAEDSEIEVTYEYFRETDEKFHYLNFGVSPSDNIQTEISHYVFDKYNPDSTVSRTLSLYNIFNEWKWKIKSVNFKVTSEFANTRCEQEEAYGMNLRSDISTEKIRLFSVYEKYDDDFKFPHAKKIITGDLHERIGAGGTYYPLSFLEFNTNWKKEYTTPRINNTRSSLEDLSGKILFSKNMFPAVSFTARQRTIDTLHYNSGKQTLKSDLEYHVPEKLLKKVLLKSLRLYGVWRKSFEDKHSESDSMVIINPNKILDNQYLRIDLSPMDMVQFNSYYQANVVKANKNGGTNPLLDQHQKMVFNATIDKIKGLNINIRYQSKTDEYLPLSEKKVHNLSLNRTVQSDMKIFPGRWYDKLNAFTFTLGYNPSGMGYLRNSYERPTFLEKFISSSFKDSFESFEDSKMYLFRLEWRPLASLIFYNGLEYYDIINHKLSSQAVKNIIRLTPKIEYKPAMNSILTLQYIYNNEEQLDYSSVIRHNPMFWIDNRWTDRLQTKLNINYRKEDITVGNIHEYSTNIAPLLCVTYRFLKDGTGSAKAEIRNDISISFYRSYKTLTNLFTNSYTNSLGIDLYPVSVLVLRFRIASTYKDILNSDEDSITSMGEVRVTAQF